MINKETIKHILKIGFYFIYVNLFLYIPILLFKLDFNQIGNREKALFLISLDLILILILYLFNRTAIHEDLKNFRKTFKEDISITATYWAVGMIFMGLSNVIIQYYITGNIAENEEIIRSLMKEMPLYIIFVTCIYAPFVEEIVFRKMFKDVLGYSKIFILASGIIFGALHVFPVTELVDIVYVIPYSSLGIAFAYAYTKTKNIFSTITMHAIHNSTFILLQLILNILG